MKTALELIAEYKVLPPEEKRIVVDYVNSAENEVYPEEEYSPEDIAKILKSGEEAERGINVSYALEGEGVIAHLQRLRRA